MRPADFLAIALVALTIGVLGRKTVSSHPAEVRIESKEGSWVYSLAKDRDIPVPGPLGVTTVRIENGTVRVVSSPCPNQTCVQQGSVDRAGAFIACLPNGVLVTVEGGDKEEVDAVTD